MSTALSRRAALAFSALLLGLGGVVVATEGVAGHGVATPVVVAPVADRLLACADTGDWVSPDRGSVGLPPGLTLCAHSAPAGGPVTIDRPGAVLDGWDLRGGIVVTAPGVTVQRSRITGDGSTAHGVVTEGAGTVRVQDTTLTGRFTEAALGGERWTAERVEVVGVAGDGAHAGAGARLIASMLSRFEPGTDVDGVEVLAADVRIEDSTVRMGAGHRSAVQVTPSTGDGPVLLRRNVLGGGGYTVEQAAPAPVATELVDNRFARDARDAALRLPPSTREEGSTYLDGAPIPRG